MRATRCLPVLLAVVFLCAGCGALRWQAAVKPPIGVLVTQYRAPLTANVAHVPVCQKMGKVSTLYVWDVLITGQDLAWDDASIDAAARQGGLSKVHYADYELMSVFGVFGQFTVRAYGE
ncbi:MAG: TRL domain-containing protein [Planctomycetota bacterium]|jgi:hypothetical protein